jgi:hypothetical protein
VPRAVARRSVAGFALTSTIRAAPFASTWVSVFELGPAFRFTGTQLVLFALPRY